MRAAGEFIQYLCVSAGMALAVSCLVVVDGLSRHVSGTAMVAAVAIAALACLAVAAAVAELASRYPSAPGIRSYLRHAFGDRVALALTFLYLLMLALIAGVEAVVLGRLVAPAHAASAFLPGVILLAVLAMNTAGIELSRRVQTVATLLLITGVGVIAVSALAGPASAAGAATGAAGEMSLIAVATAVALSFFLFTGFEWVTPLGRSPRAYRRMIPAAMLGAVVVLGVVYALFALAINHSGSGPAPHVAVARRGLGPAGPAFAVTLSLLAVFTSFNAGILGASRLVYGIAREGQLPAWCAHIWLRTGAPVGALSLIGALATLSMALIAAYDLQLAAAAVAAAIVAVTYAALLMATARLRGGAPAGFVCPIPSSVLCAGALCLALLAVAALLADPYPQLPLAVGLLLLACVASGPDRGAARSPLNKTLI